jgi:hypothetical protein
MATTPQPAATQSADEKRKRMRSPEHPFINLETALKRAKQFYDVAIRNAISINSAMKSWGYAVNSSGGLQTTAALISFGLLKDEGTGDKRKVQLTPLALRILLDVRPDSPERPELIKQAALAPKIHKQLWERWGAARPNDMEIRHVLTVEWQPPFNEKSVDGFIKEYTETVRFANLDQSDEAPVQPADQPQDGVASYAPRIGDYVQWEQNGILVLPEPTRVCAMTPDGKFARLEGSDTGIPIGELIREKAPAGAATPLPPIPPPQALPGTRTQKDIFSLKEGEVTLFWPSPLSEDSVKDVSDWLEIVKRKFARAVPAKDNETKSSA